MRVKAKTENSYNQTLLTDKLSAEAEAYRPQTTRSEQILRRR